MTYPLGNVSFDIKTMSQARSGSAQIFGAPVTAPSFVTGRFPPLRVAETALPVFFTMGRVAVAPHCRHSKTSVLSANPRQMVRTSTICSQYAEQWDESELLGCGANMHLTTKRQRHRH